MSSRRNKLLKNSSKSSFNNLSHEMSLDQFENKKGVEQLLSQMANCSFFEIDKLVVHFVKGRNSI